jgi:uncharacterized protein (TIGR03067 family)
MRILLAIAVTVLAVPDRPDPTPKDMTPSPQQQILGDWSYIGNAKDSASRPGAPAYVFRILPTETIWIQNGQPSPGNGLTANITLDWTKSPATIDFMPRRGGTPLRGIVKVEGDHLTLAWSNNDTRPPDFVAPHNVHHFTRIKK